MTIVERYKWPVIVAAGVHGALVFCFPPEARLVATTLVSPVPPWIALPPTPMEMPDPEDQNSDTKVSGGVDPLPTQMDIPSEVDVLKDFTMPVVEMQAPTNPVADLKNPPGPFVPGSEPGNGFNPGKLSALPSELDRAPRALVQGSPDYPYALRQEAVSGSVVVEFLVGLDGQVVSANAVRYTHREFADPAIRAVLKWKFEPGTIKGKRTRFRMAVPIEFNATK